MTKQSGNATVSSDFLRVLLALKKNVMKDTFVAEVAKITKVSQDSYFCTMLSNSNISVECVKLQEINVQQDDVVLIVFTNTDFRKNLTRLKNNQTLMNNSQETLHSLNYGVIIGLIYRKETE